MEKTEPERLHARAVVIQSVNKLIDTFLRKATRRDVDLLAGATVSEDGMLLFRDSTGMSVEVRVAFGQHLDREATEKLVGVASATRTVEVIEQEPEKEPA